MKIQLKILLCIIFVSIFTSSIFALAQNTTREERRERLREWIKKRREKTKQSLQKYGPGETITVDGRERTYLIHIPPGFNSTEPYPLVLVFHGGAGNGEQIARQTSFREYADKEGFIVVFPNGIQNGWNDGRGTTDPEKLGVDDIKFIRKLIEHLKSKLPIDSKMIYAAGVSNGGIFSQRVACELSDVIAAIGSDVGPIATKLTFECNPSQPISIVAIQGTVDPSIPINGGIVKHKTLGFGDGGLVESAKKTMRFWASKNTCSSTTRKETLPALVNDGTTVEKTTYSGCRGNTEVVYYIVNGMGHVWPPKEGQVKRISGPTSHNINATKVFWDFFKDHPRSGSTSNIVEQ